MVGEGLPLGLDQALSADDGLRRSDARMDEITPPLVAVLRGALTAAERPDSPTGDAEAARDLHAWVAHARALLAWRTLIAQAPHDLDDFRAKVTAAEPDDAFADVCLDMLEAGLAAEGPGARTQAAVASAVLAMAAEVTGLPSIQGAADFGDGRRHFVPQAHGAARGEQVDRAELDAARRPFNRCADNPDARVRHRGESLADLAWIAGEGRPDEIAALQARWEEIQAAAPDPDLDGLRRIRRDRAWWAVHQQNHAEALRLHEANLADAERALFDTRCFNAAQLITRGNDPDYQGAIQAASALGDSARTVELIEDQKARALHHATSILATGPPSASPHLARRRAAIQDAIDAVLIRLSQTTDSEPRGELKAELERLIDLWAGNLQRSTGRVLVRELVCLGRRTVAQIASLLPDGVCYLAYHWTVGRVLVGVVDQRRLVGDVVRVDVPLDRELDLDTDAVGRAEMNVWMTIRMRGHFGAPNQIQQLLGTKMQMFWPEQFLRQLYQFLIAPVAERITAYHTLVVSPRLQLADLPFHCLIGPDSAPLLLEKAIAYVAGARHLCSARQRPGAHGRAWRRTPACSTSPAIPRAARN